MNVPSEFCREFTLISAQTQFRFEKDGMPVFYADLADGTLSVSAVFSYSPVPLVLTASARPGDLARLVFRPCRIELYLNGVLADENWPCGELLLNGAEQTVPGAELRPADLPAVEETPSFCGSFVGAEGWYPGGGVFAGDCMPYSDGERYHVLYLKDRRHHHSKWGKGAHQWAHLSTADLIRWDVHPMAVPITRPWEGSICTGSWIFINGRHYLYYTVRTMDGSPAPIMRSVSEDGWHFRKDEAFAFVLSDRYTGASARDPKVVRSEDGRLHMFVTTTDRGTGNGCLAHLISEDGEHFSEAGNIFDSPTCDEPECSDYFTLNGRYYLIFSLCGRGQYRVSDRPFEGWRKPDDSSIPCSSVPKCAVWNGRVLFTGFKGMGGYAGSLTFTEAVQTPDGTLAFKPVAETEAHRR